MSSPGGLGTDRTKAYKSRILVRQRLAGSHAGRLRWHGSGMEARWLLVVMSGLR
jgi:hypothetical protein